MDSFQAPDHNQHLGSMQRRARLVPVYIRLPLILGAFGLAIYWLITETGPAGWIIDLQVALFDGYYVVLTYLLVLLICIGPLIPVIHLLARFYGKKATTPPDGNPYQGPE